MKLRIPPCLTFICVQFVKSDLIALFESEYAKGNLDSLPFLMKRCLRIDDVKPILEIEFQLCCFFDEETSARALYNLGLSITYVRAKGVFRIACERGHESIARWLFSLGLTPEDLRCGDNEAFRGACFNGHESIARWLYDVGELTLADVRAQDNFAFRWACANGHESVARWLHSLGLNMKDVRSDSNFAFKEAYENGHRSLALWICNLGIQNLERLRRNQVQICSK